MSLHSKVIIGTSVANVSEKRRDRRRRPREWCRTAADAPAPTGRRQQTVKDDHADARARPVRAVPASARAPRAGCAGQRARAPCGQCRPARARPVCAGLRARAPCAQCGPARARPVRAVPASARAPRADSAGLRARAGSAGLRARAPRAGSAGQRARAPCGQCLPARACLGRPRAGSAGLGAAPRADSAVPACGGAQADGSRRARARRQPLPCLGRPLPTCALAWPTTADARACLGRPLRTCAQAWADHCRCTSACEQACARAPGPAPADVGALGRTDGSFDPGLGHFFGTWPFFLDSGETRHRSRGKATGTDDVRRKAEGRGRPDRHHLFHADARTRSPCGGRDLAIFDPGLGRFFGTRAKQGTRAGGSPRAVPGERMGIGGAVGGRDESKRQRAESQRIVAARPLCRLQYPVAYLSRLQRILPAARWELYFKAASAARPPRWLGQRHVPLGALGPLLRVGKRTAGVRVASSPDSDLEAFSHNPAHGSFAPLAFSTKRDDQLCESTVPLVLG
ncbi:UNVERIFIED_CONTAM: hypothetical protein Sindi_2984700 [Sesamum indicum]